MIGPKTQQQHIEEVNRILLELWTRHALTPAEKKQVLLERIAENAIARSMRRGI